MLSVETAVFLESSDGEDEPFLGRGKVLSIADDLYDVQFEDLARDGHEGDELVLFFKEGGTFVRQSFEICTASSPALESCNGINNEASRSDVQQRTLTLKSTGLPNPADQRRNFRLSTVISDLTATVDDVQDCQIIDVSMTGLAIKTQDEFSIGREIDVRFVFEGVEYSGSAFIESACVLNCGRSRYGLSCFEATGGEASLAIGLKELVTKLQRQQLRHISRSA